MSAPAEKVWQPVLADEAAARALADATGQPLPVARLLWARGCRDAGAVDQFLNPRLSVLGDPFLLPDLRPAVERVWRAIDGGERIAVFGDYDVDGITSTALLTQVLRKLGGIATPFLPHRLEEGYGLSPEALQRCLESCNPALIITVDCGTGSVEAVAEATRRGVDVIVTDHHHPGALLAPALALVNPKLSPDESIHMLAGVGVTFKLCHGLAKHGRELGRASAALDLRPHLDLVALGTIADIVPLAGENRILARHGLNQLNQTTSEGLQALIEVAAIEDRIDAYEVGFRLGPRLNAAGRLGDAQRALDLLLGGEGVDVDALAKELDQSNRERQEIEAATVRDALGELEARFDPANDFGLVVGRLGWHPGVVGIVASRLLQRFHRPVAVIALSEEGGRGSCRSIEGFDMVAGLTACADELAKYGGHAMAAGLELKPGRLDAFATRFNETARDLLAGRDLRPVQRIDAWLGLDEVDDALADSLDRMRPFGVGNATPVWGARGVRIVGAPRVVGKGHLKLVLANGARQIEAMGWGMGERGVPDGPIDVAFQIKRDRFRGQERLVLHLQDFRPAERET
ncbi:MAG TPA: single-stranded-DNA-specific exonuclease RecJ [Kiritimatiellia bacterium]|nr:single-stranded-DNA-specific exonuclease RecJ [Kiritimatiellia bacterium]